MSYTVTLHNGHLYRWLALYLHRKQSILVLRLIPQKFILLDGLLYVLVFECNFYLFASLQVLCRGIPFIHQNYIFIPCSLDQVCCGKKALLIGGKTDPGSEKMSGLHLEHYYCLLLFLLNSIACDELKSCFVFMFCSMGICYRNRMLVTNGSKGRCTGTLSSWLLTVTLPKP